MNIKTKTAVVWVCRIVAAVIMLQTLFFKFTGAEESVYIFTKLCVEPWGRIASGVMELVASMLILMPRTTVAGAIIGLGIMGGAILSHLTVLGIRVQNDGGQLFIYALLVFAACLVLVIINLKQLTRLLPSIASKRAKQLY